MALDFTEFFKRYEAIIGEADQVFETVRAKFADNVRCEKGCSDCCHALFDLTLVEALYLNAHFLERYSGRVKDEILTRADDADRLAHRLKRDAYKAAKDGRDAQEILAEMAKVRVRCPLLDDTGACLLYDCRPVTCRIYGVPTAIGGQSHTCGKSGFEQGKPYPTVYLDRIQDKLYALSHELAGGIGTRYQGLGEVLVPVSMALLTDYSEEYLGVGQAKPAPAQSSPPEFARIQPEPAATPMGVSAAPSAQSAPRAQAPVQGKGLAQCSGCSTASKPGGCSGCSPQAFTIGQAAKKATKKPAAKKPARKSKG